MLFRSGAAAGLWLLLRNIPEAQLDAMPYLRDIGISFPVLASTVGLVVTYGFYALSALVSFFFVRAMVHETKGMELEQMRG